MVELSDCYGLYIFAKQKRLNTIKQSDNQTIK